MLSPTDSSPRTASPSACSIDSGYESMLAEEDATLAQAGDQTKLQEDLAIEPHTKFNIFASNRICDHGRFLPEISRDWRSCIECKSWKSINPSEEIKCYTCRLPKIIDPIPFFHERKSKASLPKLRIPAFKKRERKVVTAHTPRSSPEDQSSSSYHASRCSACEQATFPDSSSSGACLSCSGALPDISPSSPPSFHSTIRRSRAGRNSKLPGSALARLQGWLDANQSNPYPSAETKRGLAEECGITEKQVTTWFTNARARQLQGQPTDNDLAVRVTIPETSSRISQPYRLSGDSESTSYLSDSVYPLAVPVSSSSEVDEALSSPQPQIRPSRRGKKKDYRRNQTPALTSPASITSPQDLMQTDQEMWQCTFCRKSLVPKSWRRHEETQHRPKAQWTCMMEGPRLSIPAGSNTGSVCAFCMAKNPSEDHFLHHHRIDDCAKRDVDDRTFFRPDHLRQHVKNFHNASLFDVVQARWKRAAETVVEGWTCGFCGDKLETWDKRETHISNHFKDGMTMDSWTDYFEASNVHGRKSKGKDGIFTRLNAGRRTSRATLQPSYTQDQPQQQSSQPQTYPELIFPDAFNSTPTTIGLGISQSQPPVLPNLPTLGALSANDCSNYIDATTYQQISSIPTGEYVAPFGATLGGQYYALGTTLDQGMHYPVASTSMFDPSIESTTLQEDFDRSLQDMAIYNNSIDYHGPWEHAQELPQQPSQTHAQPQSYQQHDSATITSNNNTNDYDFTNIHDLSTSSAAYQRHIRR